MSGKPARKRRALQPPSDFKTSKINRASFLQICTLNADQRRDCPKLDLDGLLASLVYPESPHVFMDGIWNNRAYAVVNAPPSRIENLVKDALFDLDVKKLIEATVSPQIFAWMKEQQSAKIKSIELSEDAALKCYECGASLYFRAPQEIGDALVHKIAEDTKMAFAGRYANGELRGEVEVFVSRKGHVTDWHFDYMHNFTIHLKGAKTWRLSAKNSISNPVRGCTPHYVGVDTLEQQLKIHRLSTPQFHVTGFKNPETVTLTPGSILYFPAGMWHRVECAEDSISINISMMPTSWSDLVSDGIRHMMWRDRSWREGIANLNHSRARAKLHGLLYNLKQVVARITVDDLLPRCLLNAERETVFIGGSEGKIDVKPKTPERQQTSSSQEGSFDPPSSSNTKDLHQIHVDIKTVFRLNPLGVLIKESDLRHADTDSRNQSTGGSLCSEDSGDETDDTKASVCAVLNGFGKKEEREQVAQHHSGSKRRTPTSYHLHINFGNESLESLIEIKFVVSRKFEPAMDYLTTRRERFTLRDLLSKLNENVGRERHRQKHLHSKTALQSGELIHLMKNMVYYGYLIIENQ
uniref:JmjC domain-containing protein n=2 Tax=Lotharella globosa TaxID=91324 RepID=A0A6V3TSE0_9EUKA|mmetsp:Transcript_3155/g.6047  ORF Transcript_3155/g.6047 Transcript_3155/m.6047 type:complete len:580 (+) Transcript_3155:89-1828(+)